MNTTAPHSILCVCLGNICRSPTAEAIFRQQLAQAGLDIHLDSAGTSADHAGSPPDMRSQQHANRRGIDLSSIRSRQVTDDDMVNFDLILAMDSDNLEKLHTRKTRVAADYAKRSLNPTLADIHLLTAVDSSYQGQPVPDPYYGGDQGFEDALDLCESAITAWIAHWQDA